MRIRGCNIRLDLPSGGIRRFGLSVATAIAVALAAPTLAHADAKTDPRATPRIDVPAQWAAGLPQILSTQDIELYRKAFAAQDAGNWAGADAALNKVKDRRPHIVDLIKNGEISLVFTTVDETRTAIADSRSIRTSAQANGVTYYTTISAARAVMDGLMASQNGNKESLEVYSLQNLHQALI